VAVDWLEFCDKDRDVFLTELVSWSGLAENTNGGAANTAQEKFLFLESCREVPIAVGIGLTGRGSRYTFNT